MENIDDQNTEAEDNLLDINDYVHYTYAGSGQRFLNFLIDNLVMRYALSYITGMGVGYLLGTFFPDFLMELTTPSYQGIQWKMMLLGYILGIFNYLIYYTLCEKLLKGYTLGKLITGTRAIRQDGNELTLQNAFMRSVIRLVPFEVFSGFGILTWHDKWTETMVVKTR
jgi:uncharacterized RDD family membrane protein YckC